MFKKPGLLLSLLGTAILLSIGLAVCSEITINVNVGGTPAAGQITMTSTAATAESPATATVAATQVASEPPADTPAPGASATPTPTATAAAATEAPTSAPTSEAQAATPAPTSAPTQTPAPPTATPEPTRQPLRPTAPSCESYQGTTYTVVLNESQINTMLDAVLQATERAYVDTRSVSLQNGQITAQVRYEGPGGQTVDGVLVLAVEARNYDVHVTVVQAQIGQAGMTDARKAAINTTLERALETEMAQAHDYTCVASITIAGGTMTIVYY